MVHMGTYKGLCVWEDHFLRNNQLCGIPLILFLISLSHTRTHTSYYIFKCVSWDGDPRITSNMHERCTPGKFFKGTRCTKIIIRAFNIFKSANWAFFTESTIKPFRALLSSYCTIFSRKSLSVPFATPEINT